MRVVSNGVEMSFVYAPAKCETAKWDRFIFGLPLPGEHPSLPNQEHAILNTSAGTLVVDKQKLRNPVDRLTKTDGRNNRWQKSARTVFLQQS
jgi:hypothetical protein